MGVSISSLGQQSVWEQTIEVPAMSISFPVALIGGGLLFLALFLQKGEPAARRKKASKEAEKAELARARAHVRELEERRGWF